VGGISSTQVTERQLITLGSLIISSVICGESLPFVIQSLWHGNQQWGPILVSTFSMALFAEILPQYAIPRQAISWAYYCWPLIWSCMWLTAIVSYPLAWILDSVAGRKHGHGLFTNDEMAAVIKYHELSEHNGGTLSPDAARVMLGALRLDSRKIGGDIALIPEKSTDDEKDLEKADLVVLQGLIVQWSAVKIINIDDVVDEAFIAKVSGWSYSRIPVIGDPEPHEMQGDPAVTGYGWEGKQIFGFLHVKVSIRRLPNPKSPIRIC
jgi:metal transporter CNNM